MTEIKYATPEELVAALSGKKRLLDVVDTQSDFMEKQGALSINGADEIIPPINRFLAELPVNGIDAVLIKYDTHFKGEYPHSPEAKLFPEIHCAWNTPGWQLVFDPEILKDKAPVSYMMKNVFDMFGSNPTGLTKDDISFSTPEEEFAYNNLFKITPDLEMEGQPRDEWLDDHKINENACAIAIGVAGDFCLKDDIAGHLKRGVTVIVPDDLTKGIVQNIQDVITTTPQLQQAYEDKKLLVTTASAALQALKR